MESHSQSYFLNVDDVHVWISSISELNGESEWTFYRNMLSEDEILYAATCSPARRDEFVATRVRLRMLLSRYFPEISERNWIFQVNEFGKLGIANSDLPGIFFSISHSGDALLLAFSRAGDVGADIEHVNRDVRDVNVHDFFAPNEIDDLERQLTSGPSDRFFEYWTLKEAFAKAIGKGFSLPFEKFSFTLSPDKDISLAVDGSLKAETEGQWSFFSIKRMSTCQIAVAVRSQFKSQIHLRIFD